MTAPEIVKTVLAVIGCITTLCTGLGFALPPGPVGDGFRTVGTDLKTIFGAKPKKPE